MSTGGEIAFVVGAVVAIVAAVLTVSVRSPLRAAMALLTNILALAGLYVTLHAHLLAAIQVLVYAGAVVVLFVFAIMLIGPSAMPQRTDQKGLLVRSGAAALMAIVVGAIAFGVAAVSRPYVDIDQCAGTAAECGQFGGVEALADAIYRDAAIPFELVSVLLLVAILAAVAVARGHSPAEKKALEERARSSAGASGASE
jgi:NADH-quinone oxidoreductase subunit J